MARVALIGLDGVPPALLFGSWRAALPVLDALCRAGAYRTLWSCVPPITVPAWSCMLSSQDPGQLGVYGFRNRTDHSYAGLRVATSRDIRVPRVWDLLSRAGGRSVVIGVPGTYPPPVINGLLVADFLTPSVDSAFTCPGTARARVLDLEPGYRFDVTGFRRRDEDSLVADVTAMTQRRFRLARALAAEPWDFFALHEIGTDRLHHRLFPQRVDELADDETAARLLAYYRVLDAEIGLLLDTLPPDTRVVVASDHGARAMRGGVRINRWLIDHGYLRLRTGVPVSAATAETIDWDRTVAWGEGGYYARVYLNIAGREPRGTLPAGRVPSLLAELRDGLGGIRGNDDRRMATTARTPADLYRAQRGIPPDLLVLFDGLACRSIGTLAGDEVFTTENDTGIDIANHSMDGVLVVHGADVNLSGDAVGGVAEPELYDVAPTILDLLGLSVPETMIGRSLLGRRPG
ncbi:MAG TPA: alkaline phosphatase family protein [Streptosporangiaceae bacterium]|nr:alkaline phosphatase family protein [Streptosporangiaceae bacterium]